MWPESLRDREQALKDEITRLGGLYGATTEQELLTYKIIKCENSPLEPTLQSQIINSKGEQEDSWGLAQIHQPSHPHIPLRDSTDPYYAINFVLSNVLKNKEDMWTCARKIKRQDSI